MKTFSKKLIPMLVALMAGVLCSCSPKETIDNTEEEAGEVPSIEMKGVPLTIEAIERGMITISNPLKLIIKYSRNDGKWVSSSSETISISYLAGDRICLFGNNAAYATISDDYSLEITIIRCSAPCYIYGNIMSLVDSEGYESATELMGSYTFACLFSYNDQLFTHPRKPIVLPATTLKDGCYGAMFAGCTGLTDAPALPATTLASDCYYSMFEDCTSLTSAPELSANSLATNCYYCMFARCTSLTSAPALPAMTLAKSCYYGMFYGCTGLTAAPELPATTLVESCYSGMFYGCSSLNYIKMLATDVSAGDCMKDWVSGVAENGSFERNPESKWVKTGDSGIPVGWKVINGIIIPDDYERPPLTLQAVEGGIITISNPLKLTIIYGKPGSMWNSSSDETITISCAEGEKIYLRGDNEAYSLSYLSKYTNIQCSSPCYVYGNIMSLVHSEGYESATDLTGSYTFACLFKDNRKIVNHPEIPLLLPATTLASHCYDDMFSGCCGLTAAPALPATTLTDGCYARMFTGCTGLSSGPELPANTLESNCYQYMFEGCTGLSSAPALPAMTLAKSCYYGMFYGCTGLTSAPELPANTLAESCYSRMFSGCSSLNYIKMLATDVSATDCMKDWVSGVPASGTFVKNKKATWDRTGVAGIPEGWTIDNISIITTNEDYAPLTLKAIEDGTVIISNPLRLTIKYGHPGDQWSSSSDENISLPYVAGEALCFLGDNATYAISNSGSDYTNIKCTSPCFLYGNIMSLVNSEDYESATKLGYLAFTGLFKDNANVIISADRPLLLPATTLASFCYDSMFYGCTSLTSAPDLPATTLASSCYQRMFYGCTSLTSAPNLPATTLASYCYYQMFYRCTKLASAPKLPATTLSNNCYHGMFLGCTSLASAPELPATTLASHCYNSMFYNCTGLTSAPKLPATTLAPSCYRSMFYHCCFTSAPDLPATTLVESCYYNMFIRCNSLNYIKMLATDISATDCMKGWVSGVAREGTFVKNEESSWNVTGASGIPEGWTVQSIKP